MTEFQWKWHDCFYEWRSCAWATFVPFGPCCMQALATDKASEEGCDDPCFLAIFFLCIGSAINRGKIRRRFGIQGSFVGDCAIWLFCMPCAACQEYREVDDRVGKLIEFW